MANALPYYELLQDRRAAWGEFKSKLILQSDEGKDLGSYRDSNLFIKQMGNSVFLHDNLSAAQLFKISKETLTVVTNNPHIPKTFEEFCTALPFHHCYFEMPSDHPFLLAETSSGRASYGKAMMIVPLKGDGLVVGMWHTQEGDLGTQYQHMAKSIGYDPKTVLEAINNVAYTEIVCEENYQDMLSVPFVAYPMAMASYIFHGDNYYIQKKKAHHTIQRKGHHTKKRYWYYYCHKDVRPPWEPPAYEGTPQEDTYWVRGRLRKYFYCPVCGKNQAIKDILEYQRCMKCGAEVGPQEKWEVHHRPCPTYARGPEREALEKGLIEGKQKKHIVKHEHPKRQEIIERDRLLA